MPTVTLLFHQLLHSLALDFHVREHIIGSQLPQGCKSNEGPSSVHKHAPLPQTHVPRADEVALQQARDTNLYPTYAKNLGA